MPGKPGCMRLLGGSGPFPDRERGHTKAMAGGLVPWGSAPTRLGELQALQSAGSRTGWQEQTPGLSLARCPASPSPGPAGASFPRGRAKGPERSLPHSGMRQVRPGWALSSTGCGDTAALSGPRVPGEQRVPRDPVLLQHVLQATQHSICPRCAGRPPRQTEGSPPHLPTRSCLPPSAPGAFLSETENILEFQLQSQWRI